MAARGKRSSTVRGGLGNSNGSTKPPATLDDIADQYLICRDLGHAWAPHDVKVSRKAGEIHRVLQCRNCPTQRTQILSMDGFNVRSRYDYPEGYVLSGIGRLTAQDRAYIRVTSTRHMKSAGL